MENITKVLSSSEKAVYSLRSLYTEYGYEQYKMSKFEEYDLYVRNKDYLVSDAVITFTDTDGKLLALKPDVTLSIIKNGKDQPNTLKKMCYAENVYRPAKGTRSFKEIMQVGLECQGDIDDYVIYEVLLLASKSLACISQDYALDISHLGIVSAVIDDACLPEIAKKQVLEALGEKNIQAIENICEEFDVENNSTVILKTLVSVYGKGETVINSLRELKLTEKTEKSLEELEVLLSQLKEAGLEDKVNVDFSVINNMKYYNGIVFKGFISGIPTGILSGGQYDNLMQKMGRKSGAIGFAVYMDELEKISAKENEYDVDVVVMYDETSKLKFVADTVKQVVDGGETVLALKTDVDRIRYKRIIKI